MQFFCQIDVEKNLRGENLCGKKMTNMRSDALSITQIDNHYSLSYCRYRAARAAEKDTNTNTQLSNRYLKYKKVGYKYKYTGLMSVRAKTTIVCGAHRRVFC